MRKSKSMRVKFATNDKISEKKALNKTTMGVMEEVSDSESDSIVEDFQFGIWLRHRRIDGALNRVPTNFYSVIFKS